jgi:hypothetical protein
MAVKGEGEPLSYSATNQNFYFLNLGVEDFYIQGKLSIKDPESSRATRGDSDITDLQLGFPLWKHWQLDGYYQKYKGYYIEKNKEVGLKAPDLSLSHQGGLLSYIFNPEYSLSAVESVMAPRPVDSKSWILSVGYDDFDLQGDLVPKELATSMKSSLESANVSAVSLRLGVGANWFWSKWYFGGMVGAGLSFNKAHYQYDDMKGQTSQTSSMDHFGFILGYRWDQWRVGGFARNYSWQLAFDDKNIRTNVSTAGLFASGAF